jgi:hypothetical protein
MFKIRNKDAYDIMKDHSESNLEMHLKKQNGDVETAVIMKKKSALPPFNFIFKSSLHFFARSSMSSTSLIILIEMIRNITQDTNEVLFKPSKLAKDLSLSRTSVYNAKITLKEMGILIDYDGKLYLNPYVAFNGKSENYVKMIYELRAQKLSIKPKVIIKKNSFFSEQC